LSIHNFLAGGKLKKYYPRVETAVAVTHKSLPEEAAIMRVLKFKDGGVFVRTFSGVCLVVMLAFAALVTSAMFLPPSPVEQAAMVPDCNRVCCT